MSAESATKRRRPGPRASTTASSRPSKLVLLGDPGRSAQVEKALEALEVQMVRADDASRTLDRETIGIVVVAPLAAKVTPAQAVRGIRAMPRGGVVPVFVIVPDEVGDRSIRRIYADGATAVFRWPLEALILARLVAELLGVTAVRGRASKPRVALTRALRAYLRLTPWSTSGIRVEARYGGQVHVSGSVPTFWRKREVERLITRVPGVKQVLSDDLWVEPSGLTDAQVGRGVRSVLRNTTTVDDATVSVAVHDGTVALAGAVADRRELRRVLDLVTHTKGVRGIRNALVVSSSAKREDRSAARRLNAMLSSRFPGEGIQATVFAGVAVLSGTVSLLSQRHEVESLIDQAPFITRVISKLEIA